MTGKLARVGAYFSSRGHPKHLHPFVFIVEILGPASAKAPSGSRRHELGLPGVPRILGCLAAGDPTQDACVSSNHTNHTLQTLSLDE